MEQGVWEVSSYSLIEFVENMLATVHLIVDFPRYENTKVIFR